MKEEIEINPSDLSISSYSSEHRSGFSTKPLAGVQITHLPTGIQVTCENERSQHKNKAIAIDMLKEKLKNLKVHPASNPILLGQAEVVNLIPENVQKMLDNEGMYLCGDTQYPEATVPIVSMAGKLYSMVIDNEMAPTRFLETLTISGPFTKED